MKLVIAVIQPDKLDEVRDALIKADIGRITITRVTGHGQASQAPDLYRGQEIAPNLKSGVRLEIACNDEFVEPAIETIVSKARHNDGELGDGKIFVLPLEECVRIRTGERGGQAI